MKNYRKHIDDFFREKLGRYTETPPADVWESLDARLDTLKPALPGTAATPYRWLWHMGMVSVIAVLGVSVARKFMSDPAPKATDKVAAIEVASVAPSAAAATSAISATSVTAAPAISGSVAADNAKAEENIPGNSSSSVAAQASAIAEQSANSNPAVRHSDRKAIAVNNTHANKLGTAAVSGIYAAAGGNIASTAARQPANIYNSTAQEKVAVNENEVQTSLLRNTNTDNLSLPSSPAAQLQKPAAAKKPATDSATKNAATQVAAKEKPAIPFFKRLEIGIKGGYERGFDNTAATKMVVAPYLQYNFSSKLAVMIQPAVKFAGASSRAIGNAQSYYQVNQDAVTTKVSSDVIVKVEGTVVNTYYHTKYNYTQTHDSIVKSNTYGGSYMEYELPVLLKYALSPKTSVYGGVNVIYSQTTGVKEHTYTKKGIRRSVDTLLIASTEPSAPAVNDIITYNGTSYTNYAGPLYPEAHENQVRLGGMLGLTYQCNKRLLLDALIQQNPAKADNKSGYNINAPLSATYFRLSVGYKLTK